MMEQHLSLGFFEYFVSKYLSFFTNCVERGVKWNKNGKKIESISLLMLLFKKFLKIMKSFFSLILCK